MSWMTSLTCTPSAHLLSDGHREQDGRSGSLYFVNDLRADRVNQTFIDAAVEARVVWMAYAARPRRSSGSKAMRSGSTSAK